MVNLKSNSNLSIFAALKVAEKVKDTCPLLLIGNPGAGKTKTVEMFARVRGYELILLRGNSESQESILGYQTCPSDTEKSRSTIRLRPDWFQEILDNQKAGKKSLLFLDEITTASEFVQAALLHLVFERSVGVERLPEDTLIVAAGNYANNLSNSMIMLPPLMNRFCIYNVIPDVNDLDVFLCKYEGALAGNKMNYHGDLEKAMREMDAQEKIVSEDIHDKIGEYIERQVRLVAKQLMSAGEAPLDLRVTELATIYSDLDGDEGLPGFISLRTLNYLRDVTVATYLCFGKEGIGSDNYKNMVYGLTGLALKRDSKTGEVIKTKVAPEFYESMVDVANDIEKMNNNKIVEYENFFNDMIKSATMEFTEAELNVLINKVREMKADQDLKEIERPLDPSVVSKISSSLVKSATRIKNYKIDVNAPVQDSCKITVEEYTKEVTYWNFVANLMIEVVELVNDSSKGYDRTSKGNLRDDQDALRGCAFKLKTLKRLLTKKDPDLLAAAPEIKDLKK